MADTPIITSPLTRPARSSGRSLNSRRRNGERHAASSLPRTSVAGQRDSDSVTVEFRLPAHLGARVAEVVGEFLCWASLPMERLADGSFVALIRLQRGRSWRYRFLVDGDRWVNDHAADDYVTVEDGSAMSLLVL